MYRLVDPRKLQRFIVYLLVNGSVCPAVAMQTCVFQLSAPPLKVFTVDVYTRYNIQSLKRVINMYGYNIIGPSNYHTN